MAINFRKAIPNSYELACRDKCNRDSLKVSINCDEASFNRILTPADISVIDKNKVSERNQFSDFCKIYDEFEGIFYPQIRKSLILSTSQLKAFDFIQDIPESKVRIILQKGLKVELEEFKDRLLDFANKNPRTRNIPVLRIDAKSSKDITSLDEKLKFIRDHFKECIVVYADRTAYKRNWELVSSRLANIKWYVFETPISEDNGFTLIAFCFSLGANAVCHRRYTFGKEAIPKFLNNDFSLSELKTATEGAKEYDGMNRREFLKDDGRKTFVYPFSRWDRIVQANRLCLEELRDLEIQNVVSFQKAYNHFTQ